LDFINSPVFKDQLLRANGFFLKTRGVITEIIHSMVGFWKKNRVETKKGGYYLLIGGVTNLGGKLHLTHYYLGAGLLPGNPGWR